MSIQNRFILLFLFLSISLFSQSNPNELIKHTIQSEVLGQDRKITISLPLGYDKTNIDYPVLYFFDADWIVQRDMYIATAKYLRDIKISRPMILVGIEQIDRAYELRPKRLNTKQNKAFKSGGADDFMEFLSKEVFPYIDQNFRTTPYKIGLGHSLGGLFVTHAMLSNPDFFNSIIAISPALGYDDEQVINKLEQRLTGQLELKNDYYFNMGTKGTSDTHFKPFTDKVDSLLSAQKFEYFRWKYDVLEGENHNTTPMRAIQNGLEFIFKAWDFPSEVWEGISYHEVLDPIEEMEKYYGWLSKKTGFDVLPSLGTMNAMGYVYLNGENYDKALEVFDMAIAAHPYDANIHDSKGELMEVMGKFDEALKYYQLAVSKLENDYDPYIREVNEATFLEHIKRVKEKMD